MELRWTPKEEHRLEKRILRLRDDQLAALLEIAGLGFAKKDIEDVVREIKADGLLSGHLKILLREADTKENLLWWLDYFGKISNNLQ